jgi:Trypsin-like peptidase domain
LEHHEVRHVAVHVQADGEHEQAEIVVAAELRSAHTSVMPDAEGNPLSEAEARDTVQRAGMELWKAAASYVVPLFWATDQGDTGGILHNGTAFFLRVDGPTMLVTAAHVVRKFQADREEQGSIVKAQVMDVAFDPVKHLIDIDDSLDIATIRVPDTIPERVGKWCYQRQASRWPPPPPMQDRGVFFVGFPAEYRTEHSGNSVEWGLYGGLLTATSVSDDRVISQLDHAYLEPLAQLPPPPLNAWLGGMSGAPGWALTQVGWRLAGVLYEYSQDYELFYFRRADVIRPDGSLVHNE